MELVEVLSERSFFDRLPRSGERLVSYWKHRFQNVIVLAAGDMLAIVFAFLVAGSIRFFWQGALLIPEWAWYLIPAWWVGASITQLLPSWGLGPVEELRRTTLLLIVVFAGAAVVLGAMFALQNTQPVPLDLLAIKLPPRSIALWVLLAFGLGGLIGLLVSSAYMLRARAALGSTRRQLAKARTELENERSRKRSS